MKETKVQAYNVEILERTAGTEVYIRPSYVSATNVEVLHKYVPEALDNIVVKTDYYFSGEVQVENLPTERVILAYDSSTLKKIGSTFSTISGTFTLYTTVSGSSFLVCLDNEHINNYNDLMVAKTFPIITS